MKRTLVTLLSLVLGSSVFARTLVIESQDSSLYEEFSRGLTTAVVDGQLKDEVEYIYVDQIESVKLVQFDLLVVAGVEAAQSIAELTQTEIPVLYTMLPRSSYKWLEVNDKLLPVHKVFYIDQPPQRYVRLADGGLSNLRSLGYLYGEASRVHRDKLKAITQEKKIKFIDAQVSKNTSLSSTLKSIFFQAEALLVLPDPYLYNRRAVQEVLLASFRYKRPLISYSESFVKAGALMAVYSTPEQIGRDIGEVLVCIEKNSNCFADLLKESYPKYFSVLVNEVTARQLGINVKSSSELQEYLEKVESKSGQ